MTYGDVDARARAIACMLRVVSAPGDRALLMLPPGLDFISTFFGCMYNQLAAVCARIPDPARLEAGLAQLQTIIRDAKPIVALTTAACVRLMKQGAKQYSEFEQVRWVAVEEIARDPAAAWQERGFPKTGDLAVLQYTSGSTAVPKGVMLSHRNIVENARMIRDAYAYGPDTTFVSWVPQDHAWGLINGVVAPMYAGALSVFLATDAFLQKPVRWLRTISQHRNVTSGGPPFGFDLCLKSLDSRDCAELDLSHWRCAVIAAEPIPALLLDRFATGFSVCGFQRAAFRPAYGLSEATMGVTDTPPLRGPRILRVSKSALERNIVDAETSDGGVASTLVGCGGPHPDQKVLIVDPDKRTVCASRQVGEIWVKGPSVALGYWGQPQLSDVAFRCYLADTGEGPFLRTGDLGFLHDGELFVTGRMKEVIVLRGCNYYPQDLEATVTKSDPMFSGGSSAAFSLEDESGTRLVILQEVDPAYAAATDQAATRIRQALSGEHGVLTDVIALVPPGSISRSRTGKLQRTACKTAYVTGRLTTIHLSVLDIGGHGGTQAAATPPRTRTELKIFGIWSQILGVEDFGIDDNFVDLGGYSITATQCLSRIRDAFGIELPIGVLFTDEANVRRLAEHIDQNPLASKLLSESR